MGREFFLSKLVHTVSVYSDANADGSLAGHDGHVIPDWRVVDGMEDIPCYVSMSYSSPSVESGQPGGKSSGTVVFGGPITIDLTNRLKWNESPSSLTETLEVLSMCLPRFTPNDKDNPHHFAVSVASMIE